MKVLFVQKIKGIGGSERYFLQLLPALARRGVECELVCVRKKSDGVEPLTFIQSLEDSGVKVHDIIIKFSFDFFLLNKLSRIIKTGDFTIVHSHLIHADFWMALIKLFSPSRFFLVSTKHGYEEKFMDEHGLNASNATKNLYYKLSKFSENHIDYSVAVSSGLRSFFVNSGIAKASKMGVIRHGFDYPNLDSSIKQKKQYRISPHQISIVGRIIPLKGHDLLLKSLVIVRETFPEVQLLIIGSDYGHQQYLENLAVKLDILNNVKFLGFQNNVNDYMTNSDILAVPSKAEGFGLTILEAYHCQVPVVAFDVPACNELIDSELSGLLVVPFDIEKLAQALIRVLNDDELGKKLVNNGSRKLKTEFSLDRLTKELVSLYTSLNKLEFERLQ